MAKVEILAMGHANFAGPRGEKGGAPSKDSIWGVAFVGNSLVKFFGRRGGKLRFKTEKKAELAAAMEMFEQKLTGNPFGKNVDARYVKVDPAKYNELIPNAETEISTGFYASVKEGVVNTRATAKKAKDADAAPADSTAAPAETAAA